jgi:Mycobacterium membrane protein
MSVPSIPSAPYPPARENQPAPPPRNGLGTAGFVLGLVGLLFSFVPFIGVVAWPLVILGLVFSAIGFARARSGRATNLGLSVAGAVLSVVGLVICIVWVAGATKAVNDVTKDANKVVTISYDATGTSKNATVTYSTFSGNGSSTGQETTNLPWHKDVQATGLGRSGELIVTAGPDGGTVGCKVTIDGVVKKTSTASGALATASCGGF